MPRPFVFVLIGCLLIAYSEASFSFFDNDGGDEQWHEVTKWEHLWRFQVGEGTTLTLGDRYICLATKSRRVVYASDSSLRRSFGCFTSGRFEVEFIQGHQVRLKSHQQRRYISCTQSGTIALTDWESPDTVFELSINDAQDRVIFYNPSVSGALSESEGTIDCNGYRAGSSSKFYGWKVGPQESWEASDEWQLIGSFDNRYSASRTKFSYATAVGIEKSSTTEASVIFGFRSEAGPDAFEAFTEGIGESDVAWESTPPTVWARTGSLSNSIQVAPRTLTNLYQAVGHYGIFTIRSLYFQARDEETRILNAE